MYFVYTWVVIKGIRCAVCSAWVTEAAHQAGALLEWLIKIQVGSGVARTFATFFVENPCIKLAFLHIKMSLGVGYV